MMSAMKKEQEKASTPEYYHAIRVKFENKLAESTKTLKFHQFISDKSGKDYCFIGPIFCGKSTLCNSLFGLKLKIGLGSCTK